MSQGNVFCTEPIFPEGFVYRRDFLAATDKVDLLRTTKLIEFGRSARQAAEYAYAQLSIAFPGSITFHSPGATPRLYSHTLRGCAVYGVIAAFLIARVQGATKAEIAGGCESERKTDRSSPKAWRDKEDLFCQDAEESPVKSN